MRLFTIGFTKKTAEEFFTLLQRARVNRVVDIRLNNTSQLAGFAKGRDLRYFLHAIGGLDYLHCPELAPTQEILDDFKKNKGSWSDYERSFTDLLAARRAGDAGAAFLADGDCLLCSEPTPEHCHRRLVADYLEKHLPDVEVIHL